MNTSKLLGCHGFHRGASGALVQPQASAGQKKIWRLSVFQLVRAWADQLASPSVRGFGCATRAEPGPARVTAQVMVC